MTLTTHAIVGGAASAAVAAISPTPLGIVGGFVLGFASHLVIDSIPHWSEGPAMLRSVRTPGGDIHQRDMELGKDFLLDLIYLGGESLLGLLVAWGWFSFGFFHFSPWAIFFGVVGGLLPDALQFVYFKTHAAVLVSLQHFHERIQHEEPSIYYLGTEAWTILIILTLLKLFA